MSEQTVVRDERRGGAVTAERILDVAERLFAERGYAGTSIRAVADAVGIQNPSIYSHFPSKSALYEAVLERAIRPEFDEFWGTEGEIEKLVRHVAAHPHAAQLILHETVAGGPRLTPMITRWMAMMARTEEFLFERDSPSPLDPASVPLRVLALYHVVAGYSASAAFYRALTGADLNADDALDEQVGIVRALCETLFGPGFGRW